MKLDQFRSTLDPADQIRMDASAEYFVTVALNYLEFIATNARPELEPKIRKNKELLQAAWDRDKTYATWTVEEMSVLGATLKTLMVKVTGFERQVAEHVRSIVAVQIIVPGGRA